MAEAKQVQTGKALLLPGHPVSAAYWHTLAEHYGLCFLYPQAADHAKSLGLICGHLGQFYDAEAQEFAANETARIVGGLHGQRWDFRNFGIDLPHDLNGRLSEWWPGYVLTHAQALAQRIAALESLARRAEIAGVVVHEDVAPDTRSMVLWAKARGIPTIHVPHANCHLRDDAGPDIHRETRADWIAAAGDYMSEWYAQCGFPRERIRIVGAPGMDALYEQRMEKTIARRVWSFSADDLIIIYATTWAQTTGLRGGWAKEHAAGLDAVLELTKSMDAKLIIKIHPNDAGGSEKHFEQRMKETGIKGRVTRQHAAYALSAADLFIAQGPSNMCVEAAIFGVPSIYLQTEGFDYAYPLPHRCTPDALNAIAHLALEDQDNPLWQVFIKRYNDSHPDGDAVKRLSEFVQGVCA